MFLGLKPPYDSVGRLEAFLGVDVTFLDSLLCLATTSMILIMLSLASYVSMGGTLISGLTVRDKYRQLKNKDQEFQYHIIISYLVAMESNYVMEDNSN